MEWAFILEKCAGALAYIHEKGYIPCDIKHNNIILHNSTVASVGEIDPKPYHAGMFFVKRFACSGRKNVTVFNLVHFTGSFKSKIYQA
jgi:serine/threonine protein kinase